MNNFEFCNPVKVIFGAGEMKKLGTETVKYGRKALLVTTRGSLKRLGIIDKAVKLLEEESMDVFILDGVEPNPRISSVKKGVEICKANGVDIVVAIGGGSVIDCAKTIAIAALDDGNPWDLFTLKRTAKGALPIGVLSTLAATGSEMNTNAVITNDTTKQKYSIHYECIFPKFSIIDPQLQVSVPLNHTAYGAFDILSHVMECYFDGTEDTPLQDRIAEGIILTTIESMAKVLKNPEDIAARNNLSWCATLALNGLNNAGRGNKAYDAHTIEHEIGAKYDIAHGAGLAIVEPAWMKAQAKKNPGKYIQFAHRIFGIEKDGKNEIEVAFEGIAALRSWAKAIGCPITLKEAGILKEGLKQIAQDAVKNPEGSELDVNEVYEVLLDCYED